MVNLNLPKFFFFYMGFETPTLIYDKNVYISTTKAQSDKIYLYFLGEEIPFVYYKSLKELELLFLKQNQNVLTGFLGHKDKKEKEILYFIFTKVIPELIKKEVGNLYYNDKLFQNTMGIPDVLEYIDFTIYPNFPNILESMFKNHTFFILDDIIYGLSRFSGYYGDDIFIMNEETKLYLEHSTFLQDLERYFYAKLITYVNERLDYYTSKISANSFYSKTCNSTLFENSIGGVESRNGAYYLFIKKLKFKIEYRGVTYEFPTAKIGLQISSMNPAELIHSSAVICLNENNKNYEHPFISASSNTICMPETNFIRNLIKYTNVVDAMLKLLETASNTLSHYDSHSHPHYVLSSPRFDKYRISGKNNLFLESSEYKELLYAVLH